MIRKSKGKHPKEDEGNWLLYFHSYLY